MVVRAERAFTDLAEGEYRRAGDQWDVSEGRADELVGYGLCSVVPEPPKPKRRATRKRGQAKSE